MNSRILIAVISGFLLIGCGTIKKANGDLAISLPIESFVDLTKVIDDKVPVTINPGRFTVETVTYRLPRLVQGSYSIANYGKYVDDFKAYDYKGNELSVNKIDTNTWVINNAIKLDYITYYVNDTFDIETEGGIGKEEPFSPGGTNIELDNYVLNLHGFIGYFDSLKTNSYKLNIVAPIDFVRSSALQNVNERVSQDGKTVTTSYFAPRYFDVTDNPMMYGDLEVEEFLVGDIKIVLSVYSPNKVHSAKDLKETVFKMMQAQKEYLGTINSTSRYDIFLYLSRGGENDPKGFGALEHHTSTVVVFPESMTEEALSEGMTDVVSHEFFHIVTPLSVHSEDVHYFDYNNPTFSKHLWMYEGVTEYFSNLFQINQDLISEDEFYKRMIDKIRNASEMDDAMSFTLMSENVIDEPYAEQYYNVYQKGALIGMCIDILLREGSNGERGILSLMKELSAEYGKDKPFEDDKLIDEIVAMTYPSLRIFFDMHVTGSTPINYNVFFEKVGLEIGEGKIETNYIQNGSNLIVSGDGLKGIVFFNEFVKDNSFWNEQGALPDDIIKSIDGVDVTLQNANDVLQEVFMWKPGREVEVHLNRKGEEVVIKTTTTQAYMSGEELRPEENPTEAQIKLREAWLKS